MRELDSRELAAISGGGEGDNDSTHNHVVSGLITGFMGGIATGGAIGFGVGGPVGAGIGAALGAGVGAVVGAIVGYGESEEPDTQQQGES